MCGFSKNVGSSDPKTLQTSNGQLAELIVYIVAPE